MPSSTPFYFPSVCLPTRTRPRTHDVPHERSSDGRCSVLHAVYPLPYGGTCAKGGMRRGERRPFLLERQRCLLRALEGHGKAESRHGCERHARRRRGDIQRRGDSARVSGDTSEAEAGSTVGIGRWISTATPRPGPFSAAPSANREARVRKGARVSPTVHGGDGMCVCVSRVPRIVPCIRSHRAIVGCSTRTKSQACE